MLWNGITTCMFQMRKLGRQREAKWHVRPYSEWETVNSGNKTLFSLTEREKWTPKWYRISATWISLLPPPYFSPRKFLPVRCWHFKRILLNLVISPPEVVFFYSSGSISPTQLEGAVPAMVGCSAAVSTGWEQRRLPGCEPVVLTIKLWQQKVPLDTAKVPWGKSPMLRITVLEERKQSSWNKCREHTLK